ncbi:MAG: hypothetical protein INQ03_25575 [Candidatus Heimdallarchaeota archaeon]|nr:hypothetical protein [Candidatus Heimdallarchaeota archaeon]
MEKTNSTSTDDISETNTKTKPKETKEETTTTVSNGPEKPLPIDIKFSLIGLALITFISKETNNKSKKINLVLSLLRNTAVIDVI